MIRLAVISAALLLSGCNVNTTFNKPYATEEPTAATQTVPAKSEQKLAQGDAMPKPERLSKAPIFIPKVEVETLMGVDAQGRLLLKLAGGKVTPVTIRGLALPASPGACNDEKNAVRALQFWLGQQQWQLIEVIAGSGGGYQASGELLTQGQPQSLREQLLAEELAKPLGTAWCR